MAWRKNCSSKKLLYIWYIDMHISQILKQKRMFYKIKCMPIYWEKLVQLDKYYECFWKFLPQTWIFPFVVNLLLLYIWYMKYNVFVPLTWTKAYTFVTFPGHHHPLFYPLSNLSGSPLYLLFKVPQNFLSFQNNAYLQSQLWHHNMNISITKEDFTI